MSNVFYRKLSELSGHRYDPSTYHVERLEAIKKLETSVCDLKKLKYITRFSKNIVVKNSDNLRYIGLKNIESNTGFYIQGTEKEVFSSAVKFKKGQVLFPKLRPYLNKVYFTEFDGLCSTEFHVFDSSVIDNHYLSIFLQTNLVVAQTKYLMSGNTLPRLQTEDIEDLLIPIPSDELQNQIVQKMERAYQQKQQKEQEAQRKLESIDSYLLDALGIELPKDKDESLEDRVFFRKFSELKGRFDGVYYSEKFIALEKALLNSNYPLMRLGDICQINRGGSPRPIHNFITDDEDGINWIKIGDTKGIDKYIYKTKQKIVHKGIKHSRMVYAGDFILSNSMSFGRPYIMKTTGCIHDGWLLLRKKENIISEDFLYSILNSALIYKFFKKETIGGVVENLSIDLVKKIKIPLPPLEIQNKIANNNQKLLDEVEALKKEATEIYNNAKLEVEKMILGEG